MLDIDEAFLLKPVAPDSSACHIPVHEVPRGTEWWLLEGARSRDHLLVIADGILAWHASPGRGSDDCAQRCQMRGQITFPAPVLGTTSLVSRPPRPCPTGKSGPDVRGWANRGRTGPRGDGAVDAVEHQTEASPQAAPSQGCRGQPPAWKPCHLELATSGHEGISRSKTGREGHLSAVWGPREKKKGGETSRMSTRFRPISSIALQVAPVISPMQFHGRSVGVAIQE